MQHRVVSCDVVDCESEQVYTVPNDVRNHQIPKGWVWVQIQRPDGYERAGWVARDADLCGLHDVEQLLGLRSYDE